MRRNPANVYWNFLQKYTSIRKKIGYIARRWGYEQKEQAETKQSANINMSQTTEINPYLLLMAHTLIKHVIEIDNNKTLGITSHTDEV